MQYWRYPVNSESSHYDPDGDSVFVTGGALNPRLSIAALALKAVDHVDAAL
ncbi:hypothetical protein [Halostella salina]|uniref:hypothetical protein n=1 Tax=Halostella salina TaxID=1547897 RepID=UPI0013CE473E|nr:hypothetical protein [Halostella salina]